MTFVPKMALNLLSDDDIAQTFVKFMDLTTPQVIAHETGTKYLPPKRILGHYRVMKIWKSCNRVTFEADLIWWMNRLRTNGVPQCIWMSEIVATSQHTLWVSFGHFRTLPRFKKDDNLETVVTGWLECVLACKNQYFHELDEIARDYPEIVVGGAQATPVPSSFIPASQIPQTQLL